MNPLRWLPRLYYTLRPLRAEQWWFRLWHPLKRIFWRPPGLRRRHLAAAASFPYIRPLFYPAAAPYEPFTRSFVFGEREHSFGDRTDWNFTGHGLLWAFQLNYFEWLEDEEVHHILRGHSMDDFTFSPVKLGLASYPSSRRVSTWVRFLARYRSGDPEIYRQLYQDACRVSAFPERHLLGNHLWENAFAVFAAAVLLDDAPLFRWSRKLIFRVIGEQILEDGAHYERSPFYHALLLKRLFDSYHYYAASGRHGDAELTALLRNTAARMLGWLDAVAFSDDSLPTVADVPPEVVPDLGDFHDAAKIFGIAALEAALGDCGYRMKVAGSLEFFVNVGDIRPAHQPGHAHADALSFVLSEGGLPLIVDPGTGTYDPGPRRAAERSTALHNTVSIRGADSSDLWSTFRVGRRARIIDLKELPRFLEAAHDGYKDRFGIVHRRRWEWSGSRIEINDFLEGGDGRETGEMRLHFDHRVKIQPLELENAYRCDDTLLQFVGAEHISLQTFEQPCGFGRYRTAPVLLCRFKERLTTIIHQELHAD